MIGDHADLGTFIASLHVESNSAFVKCWTYDRVESHVGVFSFDGAGGPDRGNYKAAFRIIWHRNACKDWNAESRTFQFTLDTLITVPASSPMIAASQRRDCQNGFRSALGDPAFGRARVVRR